MICANRTNCRVETKFASNNDSKNKIAVFIEQSNELFKNLSKNIKQVIACQKYQTSYMNNAVPQFPKQVEKVYARLKSYEITKIKNLKIVFLPNIPVLVLFCFVLFCFVCLFCCLFVCLFVCQCVIYFYFNFSFNYAT